MLIYKLIKPRLDGSEPVDLKSHYNLNWQTGQAHMIDEELYQRATKELDSEARKPDVWARACALASDDHDEARFLYTNLRVEEMINKDGKQRTFSADRHRREPALADADDADLPDDLPAPNTAISTEDKHVGQGVLSAKNARTSLEMETKGVASGEVISSEVISNGILSANISDNTPSNLATNLPTNALTRSSANALNSSSGSEATTTLKRPIQQDVVSEVKASTTTSPMTPEQRRTSELTQSLERQAKSMNNGQKAIDQDETADITPLAKPIGNTGPTARKNDAKPTPAIRSDYANANAVLDADNTLNSNLNSNVNGNLNSNINSSKTQANKAEQPEGSSGKGPAFLVFNRHGSIKSVKQGVSWTAMFFTLPWLLSKALFGTAIIYSVLWVVTLVGLYVTGTSWLDAGAAAPLSIKLWTAAFGTLAVIGLLYVPFRYGNRWVAEKLKNKGYVLQTSVNTTNKSSAVKHQQWNA